jgi:16S rRNA processing protein RimM
LDRPGTLLAGQIGKPHGIGGEVYVVRISDDPERFAPGASLLHQDGRELVIESARPHRDHYLVKFEGVDTRGDAEALRGELYVPFEQVRGLEADEFWPHDLVGSQVVTTVGSPVGVVTDVRPGSAHDLLVVDTDSGQRLIPAVKAIVTEVDIEARVITIDPPPGLLE